MGRSESSLGIMGLCAFVMAMTLMAMGVAGQGPAAGAPAAVEADCDAVVLELVDCLGFVMGQAAAPSATCCSNLSSVITTAPQCLCQLYNTTFTAPLGVNVTLATQLPPLCKLTTPDPSLCALIGIPVPGPVAAAAPISPAAPMSPAAPGTAPSSAPTPVASMSPTVSPSTAPISPVTSTPPVAGPGTETQPGTVASPPPSPNSASSIVARGLATASSLLGAAFLAFY